MTGVRVLIVEDEPINLEILAETLSEAGYETLTADSGETAWAQIKAAGASLDAVLLDRLMPDMDGIEILKRMKGEAILAQTPVIMQTAMNQDADIAEGLKAGAFYYLTKPINPDTLLAIVAAAVADKARQVALRREADEVAHGLSHLQEGRFLFRTPSEAREIATALANIAPDPGRVVLGLSELLLNAVEHGNLGITYKEKSALIAAGELEAEIHRRLDDPVHGSRKAEISVHKSEAEILFLITDKGEGFDWEKYLELSPDRVFDTHGRGIAMSRILSFSKLEYMGCGNQVLAKIDLPPISTT